MGCIKQILCISLLAIVSLVNAQKDLPQSATDISPLLIGEKIPNVILKSVDDSAVNLVSLLENKRTILVFYRGGWCPYCNAHLAALGEAEQELINIGYQIIAISPDKAINLKKSVEKGQLNYQLLSDSNGELSRAMGIAFKAPFLYKVGIKKKAKGNDSSFLPVPSLFIVDGNGTILFEYIAPDYKHRITNDLLLAVAKSLK